jgi:hypothetical protein
VDLAAGFGQIDDGKRDAGVAIGRSTGPVNESVLTIGVYYQDAFAFFVEGGTEVHRDGAFPDATLLLRNRDDFSCQFFTSFLDADGFYRDEFLFQSLSSFERDELAVRPGLCA